MFIRINSGAISGIDAVNVTAEVNVASGGIGLYIVGLPDNTIKESHERIQAAFENSGYRLIAKKTVVNLAPADLRKEGSQYDIAIAVGILTATEQIHTPMLEESMFIGELSLNGVIRPVKGVLPLVAMARKRGLKRVFMQTQFFLQQPHQDNAWLEQPTQQHTLTKNLKKQLTLLQKFLLRKK